MKWLDGKKTIIGASTLIVTYGPQIVETVGDMIRQGGGDPVQFLKVAGYVLTVVGLAHKLAKAVA